jgi:hypothetical protein
MGLVSSSRTRTNVRADQTGISMRELHRSQQTCKLIL